MSSGKRLLLIAVVAFAAAMGGTYAGRIVFFPDKQTETELHALLHKDLNLNAVQHAQIEAIEQRFTVRRKALELEMRAANAKLAAAIETEHGYGPQVSAAIDQSHSAMGQLQKETLEHVFAMRGLLRSDQTAKFDRAVVKALTADQK